MFSEDERVEANADFDEPKDEIAERIFRIRSKYIPCPQETKVRQYIDRLYRTGRGNPAIGESPDMLAILGPARSGKTRTTLEWYLQHPCYVEATAEHYRDIMPVLFVRCPGKATMKALFKKIQIGRAHV